MFIHTKVLSQVWKNHEFTLNLENFHLRNPIGVWWLSFVMVVCGKSVEIKRTNNNYLKKRDT